jgi:hypothetical protein
MSVGRGVPNTQHNIGEIVQQNSNEHATKMTSPKQNQRPLINLGPRLI